MPIVNGLREPMLRVLEEAIGEAGATTWQHWARGEWRPG